MHCSGSVDETRAFYDECGIRSNYKLGGKAAEQL